MPLSLAQSDAVADMAGLLYDYLPGSGDRGWKGHVTFATVAKQVGVGDFWLGGSKEKALVSLLSQTLEHRSHCFEKLLLGIVREGLTYHRRTNPVTKSEILQLNGLLKRVGFKFPDLWDPVFLDSLAEKKKPAQEVVPTKLPPDTIEFRRKLEALRSRY